MRRREMEELMAHLREADPVDVNELEGATDDAVAQRTLESIVGSEVPARRTQAPRRRFLAGAVALGSVALALGAIAIVNNASGPDEAVAALNDAARAAAVSAPSPSPDGRVLYSKVRSADLVTSGGPAGGWSVLVPKLREEWVLSNGAGRLRETAGKMRFLGERDRAHWKAAGSEPLGSGLSDKEVPAGTLTNRGLSGLPTHPAEVAAEIRERAQRGEVPLGPAMLVLIGDLLRDPGASPEQRSALYRTAATIEGVELVGAVRDPIGRRGIAVGIESDYSGGLERYELIFDPEGSELLAERTVLLEAAQFVDAAPPAVIGYSVYLASRRVASTSTRR